MGIIFVTGGARSGKSRLAEQLALSHGEPVGYVATGMAGDAEMEARIVRHRARRGAAWRTIEEPLDVAAAVMAHHEQCKAMLIDCVTLWVTNLLLKYDHHRALEEVRKFAALASALQTPLITVTNEVGQGIVPDNALARLFRDLAGEANQVLAAAADEVYVVFSGLPLKLKG